VIGEYTRHLRWGLRSRMSRYPSVYLPVARRKYGEAVLQADTRLVIDGFTRSGVTFAVIAFNVAQPTPVPLAHTLHAPGHVIAAVRAGVPTLVVVRDPEAAVLSAVIREPYVSVAQGLRAWVRFHTQIRPYRSGFVIGQFERVTDDYASVIRDVNARFGTDFATFDHTEQNVELCFSIIEDRSRRPPWSEALGKFECGRIGLGEYLAARERFTGAGDEMAEVPELRVPRPSAKRDELKRTLAERLADPRLTDLRQQAHRLFVEYGGEPAAPHGHPPGPL